MISASPIARLSVIQILDDGDAAFRILGAGLRTVLSVTTMFADKPHRLNGRMRATILCFDDLASGYRTRGWATRAAGYRAAISCLDPSRTSAAPGGNVANGAFEPYQSTLFSC